MAIRRSDFIFAFMAVALTVVGTLAISNTDSRLGLFTLLGLAGVIMVMSIIVSPSIGAYVLIVAVFTNISKLLVDMHYPSVIKPLVGVVAIAIAIHYSYAARPAKGGEKTVSIQTFLVVFFLATAISFLFAEDQDVAMTNILDLGKDIVIIYCIVFALRQTQTWKHAAWLMIITTTLLCLMGLYQIVTHNYTQTFIGMGSVVMQQVLEGSSSSSPRIAGPINAPNMWAQVVVAVIPIVIYRIIYEPRRWVKIACIVILGILLFEVLNTYSRGAFLALAVVFLLIMLSFRVNPLIPIAGVTLMVIVFLALPPVYRQRFDTLQSLSPTAQNGIYQDNSFRGRASEMLAGLYMFADHPLFGLGAGNYEVNYQAYAQKIGLEFRATERQAHSLYIQILSETGLLGGLAFFGIVASLFAALAKTSKALSYTQFRDTWLPWITSLRMSLIGYLITALFLHDAYIRYFWIIVALCISAIRISSELVEQTKHHPTSLEARP